MIRVHEIRGGDASGLHVYTLCGCFWFEKGGSSFSHVCVSGFGGFYGCGCELPFRCDRARCVHSQYDQGVFLPYVHSLGCVYVYAQGGLKKRLIQIPKN